MTYRPVPSVALETPFGLMKLVVPTGTSVRLFDRFDEVVNNDVTINGVAYNLTADFSIYPDSDGKFVPNRTYYGRRDGATEAPEGRYHEAGAVRLRRKDNFKEGSPAAVKKALSVLGKVLNEWAQTPEGKALLASGGLEKRERDRARLVAQVEEARKALKDAEVALRNFDSGIA